MSLTTRPASWALVRIVSMPRLPRAKQRTISEITRRDIFDMLTLDGIDWAGRLEESDFLALIRGTSPTCARRMVASRTQPATSGSTASIIRRIGSRTTGIFTDSRFDPMYGDDDTLLRFLAEMVHPAVRPEEDETRSLVESINKKLGADGWALVEVDQIPAIRSSRGVASRE